MDGLPANIRRVLVTGGAGFIGTHVCEEFVRQGVEVVCVDNGITASDANLQLVAQLAGVTVLDRDVCALASIDGRIDAVVHLACPASPKDYARLPLETLHTAINGTVAALEIARSHGARFLVTSTSEVYGDPHQHPQREDYWGNVNPIGPRAVYDEGKRAAETFTVTYQKTLGVDTRIARVFNTYGPRMRRDDGRALPNFVDSALTGRPLVVFGDGSQTRSLCFVSDLVDGLFRLLASDEHGPVNLGNTTEITMLELAKTVRDLCGGQSSIEFASLPVDDPRQRRPDLTRARTILGWQPQVALADGIAAMVEWWRQAALSAVPS